MNVPLWGREAEAEALAAAIVSADGVFVVEIISEPEAPGRRFVEATIERLEYEDIFVQVVSADSTASVRPGALANDIEQGWPDDGPVVIVIQAAHLADGLSLSRLVHRSVGARTPSLIIERLALSGSELNPFSNIQAIGERLGTYQQITLAAPTIDDISVALDIDRSAAAALHNASAGDDQTFVSALAVLEESDDSAPLLDLEQFLSRLAHDAAPLGELDDLDRHLVELVTVGLSPIASRVLAVAAGAPEREVLGAIEGLARDGFLIDTVSGIQRAATPLSDIVARSLSASRRVAANRSLAVALQESGKPVWTSRPILSGPANGHRHSTGIWRRQIMPRPEAIQPLPQQRRMGRCAASTRVRRPTRRPAVDCLSLVLATSGSAHIPIAHSTTSAPQHRCSTALSG